MTRRVVITGYGLISPIGNNPEKFWRSLEDGQSGIELLQSIPPEHLPSKYGGEARDFSGQIGDFGQLEKSSMRAVEKGLRLMCREIEMGVAAAQLAIQHGGLDPEQYNHDRVGTIYGSDYILTEPYEFISGVQKCMDNGSFDFTQWADKGLHELTPLWLLKYLPNMPASHIAIYNDFRGPNNSITLREASANLAIGEAFCTIQRNCADTIIAGATGSRVHAIRSLHIMLLEQVASGNGDAKSMCRPFDQDRTGMVIGEGAGALILEELSSAEKRGATIYGEVVGYGSSTVNQGGVAQFGTALKNSMLSALRTSGMQPDEVGHIHAHGLATTRCDLEESEAINEIFGADKPVTALKSYMGNLGAGSGVVELIASLLAMQNDKLFPVLNCDSQDAACRINVVKSFENPGDSVLNTNVTAQGQASAIMVKRFTG